MSFVSISAFEEFRKAQNEKLRSLTKDVANLRLELAGLNLTALEHEDEIEKLKAAVTELQEGEESEVEFPTSVMNLETLKQFTLALLGPYATESVPGAEKKLMAQQVRDSLASSYPLTIKRLQDDPAGVGYSASETKHSDAFWYVPDGSIIDFVNGSDADGVLYDSLTWRHEPITPWGN